VRVLDGIVNAWMVDAMVTLFVCGDVMLARGIDQILAEPCDPKLYEPHMNDARDYIAIAEEVSGPIPAQGDALAILERASRDEVSPIARSGSTT
jgi:poly-gamma-glutamate synthesis protein (capsule biosynthesis protein)